MLTPLLLILLPTLATAQSTPQANYPYTIDPTTISQSDRDAWCTNQIAQCPLICTQQPGVTSLTTLSNDCDADALTYSCVCENGIAPNVTQYSQTLPFYICQAWGTNCVNNCGDNTCADRCRTDHPCGAQSPFRGNTSIASTSTLKPTASGAQTKIPVSGFGGAQATGAAGAGSDAAAGVGVGGIGVAVLVGSVVLGFGVML